MTGLEDIQDRMRTSGLPRRGLFSGFKFFSSIQFKTKEELLKNYPSTWIEIAEGHLCKKFLQRVETSIFLES